MFASEEDAIGECMEEIILETKDLTKRYRGYLANDHVTLRINKGDIYGFIGVNGAGKTTFMKMICDLIKPSEGSYSLMGESSPNGLAKARQKMGVLIERPALYTDMTALQNLEIQGCYKNYKPADGKGVYLELLDRIGLLNACNEKVRYFSMGMKQRLGLALCLVGEPDFIILDEPYVSLDPVGINDFRNLLLELNKNGVTILFSCHTLAEMTKLATRYGFINKGKLEMEITAEKLDKEMKEHNENLEEFFLRHFKCWSDLA